MHRYTLRCSLQTTVSVEEAFEVFQDPHNLARITPPWLSFRVLTPGVKIEAGARLDYRIAWLGLPMTWRTLIAEYEPPFYFVDEQLSGPYAYWRHRHTFQPGEMGTVVSDEVVYALPFGPLGQLAHRIAVGRQLRGIFRYRQKALGELIAGVTVVEEPLTR